MTRAEAISKWIYPAISTMWTATTCKEILDALDQEPVFDNIKAEIREFVGVSVADVEVISKNDVLDIIDKHIEG